MLKNFLIWSIDLIDTDASAVTQNLVGATSSFTGYQTKNGQPFTAMITADDGLTLGSVIVTMGGTDISSTAVSGGAVTISNVTGDIVITATASS